MNKFSLSKLVPSQSRCESRPTKFVHTIKYNGALWKKQKKSQSTGNMHDRVQCIEVIQWLFQSGRMLNWLSNLQPLQFMTVKILWEAVLMELFASLCNDFISIFLGKFLLRIFIISLFSTDDYS